MSAVGVTAVCVFFLIVEVAAECSVLVTDCLKTLPSPNSGDKFLYSKEERDAACGNLQSFLKCLEATGCQRLDPVQPVYKGFKDALNFTCNEDNHQHEKASTCWEWDGFPQAQKFCYEMVANRSDKPTCDERLDMTSCFVRSVGKCCGKESADYANKSATLMLEPHFLTEGCPFYLDPDGPAINECSSLSAPSGPNVGLIVVIIFVIIIIVVVVVVVIIIRKSGSSRQWVSM